MGRPQRANLFSHCGQELWWAQQSYKFISKNKNGKNVDEPTNKDPNLELVTDWKSCKI